MVELPVDRVLSYILPRIQKYHQTRKSGESPSKRPFVLGLGGVQGSGKSTWAKKIGEELGKRYGYKVLSLSLDDLYHNHKSLVDIRNKNPTNRFLRTRGQPGTHDEELAQRFFESLESDQNVRIPAFDKSRFNGEGDRVPEDQWQTIPRGDDVEVLIFEGWCMGFQAVLDAKLMESWNESKQQCALQEDNSNYSTAELGRHRLEHVRLINRNLQRYNDTFMAPKFFNYFVLLDADKLTNVYIWRLQQEHDTWKAKGSGMTDQKVVEFVQGYIPAYELYLPSLQLEAFVLSEDGHGNHLTIVMDIERNIISMTQL